MTKKTLLALLSAATLLSFQLAPSAITLAQASEVEEEAPVEEPEGFYQTVITSAYYSPLVGQVHYATGSYDGDIYLNGRGTNGADGTEVFPGMIAAPPEYAFGTKINIPGIGVTSVHDRGGAIKSAGVRGNAHDRLDIWMGWGDEGLTAALNWGKRTQQVFIYGSPDDIETQVYFDVYTPIEQLITQTILNPLTFPQDIYFGSEGDDVRELQNYLIEWAYLSEATGFYGEDTQQAVFQFQIDHNVIDSADELGAGHTGPSTRRAIENVIQDGGPDEDTIILSKGRSLMEKYEDLQEGDYSFVSSLELGMSGDTVTKLQKELIALGYLRIAPTAYFGESTAHAVGKFQQSQGLVTDSSDAAYGFVGPATRTALNRILGERVDLKSRMAYQREEVETGRHIVNKPSLEVAIVSEEE